MTFEKSIGTVFRKYATFEGRASRAEFWWFALFAGLVSLALSALWGGLSTAWGFVVLLPFLAVGIRRLRDAGFAWPMIFLVLIPAVGIIIVIVLWAQRSIDDPSALTGTTTTTSTDTPSA